MGDINEIHANLVWDSETNVRASEYDVENSPVLAPAKNSFFKKKIIKYFIFMALGFFTGAITRFSQREKSRIETYETTLQFKLNDYVFSASKTDLLFQFYHEENMVGVEIVYNM